MKKILPRYLVDRSTGEEFCFSLACEECGNLWHSRKKLFSKAKIPPGTYEKKIIYATIYQKEWERARQEAAEGGKEHFNVCPICHRIVCDACFMVCEELDLCRKCAAQLNEKGEAVAEEGMLQSQC